MGAAIRWWLLGPFLALLALAPLPLGSNRPIPWTVLAVAVAVLLLAWCARAAILPARDVAVPKRLLPSVVGLGLVFLVVVVQVLPLTPRAWHHPLWLEAIAVLGNEVSGAVSVDPHRTGTALMRLLTYVGVFWLALQLGRAPHGARRIVQAIAFAGLAYALYGLLTDHESLLWWRRWAPMHGITSTFVNRNHYATYAGLGLLCAFGLLITTIYRVYARARRHHARGAALGRITWRGWWLAAATVCLALAVVSTSSRAGFASSAIAFGALIGLLGTTHQLPKRAVRLCASLAIVLGLGVVLLGGDDLSERIAKTDIETESRFPIYGRIAAAVLDAPWLGTGYGTFETLFRGYQSISDRRHWEHAHNTYLENAFELGVPAALVLVVAIGWVAWRCALDIRQQRGNTLYPCLGVAATVLVGLHALLDFSLELPAIAVTYAAILGAAYGSTGDAKAGRRSSRRRPAWRSSPHRFAIGATTVAGVVVAGIAVPRLGAQITELPARVVERQLRAGLTLPIGKLDQAISSGHNAIRWSRDPEIWWRIGLAELSLAQRPGMLANARKARLERAEGALGRSLGHAPAKPTAWAQLAYAILAQGGDPARVDRALRLSVLTGPNHTGLMPLRSALAIYAWDGLSASTRALFRPQFAQTLLVAPQRFAERLRPSGRIDVVRAELNDRPELRAVLDRILLILGRE